MKSIIALASILSISSLLFTLGCKKSNVENGTKETLILGKWNIVKIELNIYNNTTLLKDSVLPYTPQPANYVIFNANGTLEYKFNKPTTDLGTYQFVGSDSVYATIGGSLYKWKNLLLTTQLFNVKNTQSYQPLPGTIVHTYQSFAR
jgi:hypothetical protein